MNDGFGELEGGRESAEISGPDLSVHQNLVNSPLDFVCVLDVIKRN